MNVQSGATGELGIAALLAFGVALAATGAIRSLAPRLGLMDVPNQRSSHSSPTPRGGGLGILVGLLVGSVVAGADVLTESLLIGLVLVAVMGIVDDLRGLGQTVKFLFQFAAALVLIAGGTIVAHTQIPAVGRISFGFAAGALTLFWLVGVTNAFNFMDGINGIAAMEGTVCAGAYVVMSLSRGDRASALLSMAIVGACLGFLPWNFPRGRIFMGDVGSAALGFLLAALGARLTLQGVDPLVIALPLMPFLFDTSITLIRRALRGENILAAHRSHLYQQLTRSGWSHAAVTALWTGLALISAGAAVLSRSNPALGWILFWTLLLPVHLGVMFWIIRRSSRIGREERVAGRVVSAHAAPAEPDS